MIESKKKFGRNISGVFLALIVLLALVPGFSAKVEATCSIGVMSTQAYRGETVRFSVSGYGTEVAEGSLGLAFTNQVTLADGTAIMNAQNFPSDIVFYYPTPLNPGDPWNPFTVVGVLDEDGKAIPHYGGNSTISGGGDFSDVGFQYFFPYARPYSDEFGLYIDVKIPENLPEKYTGAKFEMFFNLCNVQALGNMHVPQYLVRFPEIDYTNRREAANYPLAAVPADFTLVYPAQRVIPASTVSPAWVWNKDNADRYFYILTRTGGETGSLSITKMVDGDAAPDDIYSFAVTKNDTGLALIYTVDGPDAPDGTQIVTDGVVKLKAGQTATMTDLEVGTDYRIVESDPGGNYITSYTITGGTIKSAGGRDTNVFAVVKDTMTAVTFTNTYKNPAKLNLKGTKTLTTFDGESVSVVEGEFVFTLTPSAGNPAGGYSWNGSNPVGVSAGGTIDFDTLIFTKEGTYVFTAQEVIPDLVPAGWDYDTEAVTVTIAVENIASQLTITSTSYSKDGISANGIQFDNHFGQVMGTDSTLIITKKDSSGRLLSGIEFYLMVSSDGGKIWADYGTTHVAPYASTNDLGMVVFRDLPSGMYKIVEITEAPAYGKPVYSPSDTFTILENETLVVEVTVVNSLVVNPRIVPTTGDNFRFKQWILLGLSGLAAIGMICCGLPIIMRKRRKGERF